MSRAITVGLAVVGGMLVLGGCGLRSVTPSAAAPTATGTAAAVASVAPSTAGQVTPEVMKRTVTVTRVIPFATRRVNDPGLTEGSTNVRTSGRTGVKTLTYEVTLTDGVQTDKRLVRVVVTRAPVARVIAVGTRSTQQCDPNYGGACVPIAGDVDCAGGSGNGPAYVRGPVQVVGSDIYDLDRDGDGTGCDS
jgi:hypothetical protein